MKRILALVLIALSPALMAQQMPQYTHHILNMFGVNPAFAGYKKCLDLKIGYREQWRGFEGAPKTAYANMHGKIAENKFNFHGIGGRVETDDMGPLSYTALNLAYAYHMRVNHKSMFSAGIAAGFLQWRIDGGAITLPETGFFDDPVLGNTQAQFLFPTIDFGLWWYRDDRFVSLAFRNLVEQKVKDVGTDTRLNRHYILTAGKVADMGHDFYFRPTVNFKFVSGSKAAIDLIGMIDYNDKIALGLGLRNGNGIMGLVRFDVFDYVTIAYSYDLTMSKIRYDGRNTHEVILGIQACAKGDKGGIPCSAYD